MYPTLISASSIQVATVTAQLRVVQTLFIQAARPAQLFVAIMACWLATLTSTGAQAQTSPSTFMTPGTQYFTVPAGVTSLSVVVKGAKGGNSNKIFEPYDPVSSLPKKTNDVPQYSNSVGGNGGTVRATLSVTPGQELLLYIGAQGTTAGDINISTDGFGGNANDGNGRGGEFSGILDDQESPIVIAGGGGGGAWGDVTSYSGGAGGGEIAGAGEGPYGGGGGTQSKGGLGGNPPDGSGDMLYGGTGAPSNESGGGGGGGGYYGGGGGYRQISTPIDVVNKSTLNNPGAGGGGGGSSYANSTFCTNVIHTQGDNAADGSITLSWVAAPPIALKATSPAIDQALLTLSASNCPISFSGQGWGKGFVITGPSGYVFSNVFQDFIQGGPITASGIKQPGTYTVTVYGDPDQTPVSYQFQVTGTGCN